MFLKLKLNFKITLWNIKKQAIYIILYNPKNMKNTTPVGIIDSKITQTLPKQKQFHKLTDFLSENESEKQYSSKISYTSGRSVKSPKQFQRTKRAIIGNRNSRQGNQNSRYVFLSPEGSSGALNIGASELYGKAKFNKEVLSDDCKTARENQQIFDNFYKANMKVGYQSNPVLYPLMNTTKNKDYLSQIKELKQKISSLNKLNSQLKEQNNLIKQKLSDFIQLQEDYKKIQQLQLKTETKLDEQKQINTCLEYIIEELNKRIQELLIQINTFSNQSSKIELSEQEFDDSTYSQQWQQKEGQLNLHTGFNKQIRWLEQRTQALQQDNNIYKKKIQELQKDLKHYEFEARITKKLREELVLEKSLRETFENKNKVLQNKIKNISKQLEKVKQGKNLQDSLQISFDFN